MGSDERMIDRWHPHQLRHNAATQLRKEYGLEAAQVILGHKTITVTQVYAEKNRRGTHTFDTITSRMEHAERRLGYQRVMRRESIDSLNAESRLERQDQRSD